jgi:hypothetical protein
LIESQALNDLRLHASSLTATLADQISRLGANSNSNSRKAVQIFGQIGQQTQSAQINASDLPPSDPTRRIIHHSLPELFLSAAQKTAVHTIVTVLGLGLNLLTSIAEVVTGHKILVVLFLLSATSNFYFSGRETWSWWTERRAEKFMARVGVRPNIVMGRSIWLRDLDDLVGVENINGTDVGLKESPWYALHFHDPCKTLMLTHMMQCRTIQRTSQPNRPVRTLSFSHFIDPTKAQSAPTFSSAHR